MSFYNAAHKERTYTHIQFVKAKFKKYNTSNNVDKSKIKYNYFINQHFCV